MNRQTDGRTDGQIDGQTDRRIDGHFTMSINTRVSLSATFTLGILLRARIEPAIRDLHSKGKPDSVCLHSLQAYRLSYFMCN